MLRVNGFFLRVFLSLQFVHPRHCHIYIGGCELVVKGNSTICVFFFFFFFFFFINILFTIGQLSIIIGFRYCTNMVINHN